MALKVKWSVKAEDTYDQVINYLKQNWTIHEVESFAERVDSLIANIAEHSYLFKSISAKKIRKATVTKHNSLYYFVRNKEIILSYFWDNRQDPKKNKFPY